MLTQRINSVNPTYNNYERVTPERLLDQSVFYKLLITQLKNQDPLSPMKPEDFSAQLVQLTQLEEMRRLNEYMKLMAVCLIGKKVIADNSESLKEITGIEISGKDQRIILNLEDGSTANLNEIRAIKVK